MPTTTHPSIRAGPPAWNEGCIAGQKRPIEPKHLWAMRVSFEITRRTRERALFTLALVSKLRGCDRVMLQVADVYAA